MSLSDLPAYLDLALLPIGQREGTTVRPFSETKRSAFSAAAPSTYRLLQHELDHLKASDRVLYVAVSQADFRRDGRPAKNATITAPGLMLEFVSKGQTFEYLSDRFLTQQENLRAIGLTLENLRAIDRYGLTGDQQQYRGFLAIEAATTPSGFATWQDAWKFLEETSGLEPNIYEPPEDRIPRALRAAKRVTHPDLPGGNQDLFQRVNAAETKLRDEGRL